MSGVALMFSGGVDSSVSAVKLLEDFDEVDLLTWDIGHGIVWLDKAAEAARVLEERWPGRIRHHSLSCAHVFRELVTSRLASQYARYRSRFIWCLGCKVSMHISTAAWCKARGLEHAGDGSADDTPYYVEQMPVSLAWFDEFYGRHGISFLKPVKGMGGREEKIRLLDANGLSRGRTLFGRNPGTQPLCLVGNAIYAPSTFLKVHPRFDPERVRAFLDDQREAFDRLVDREARRWSAAAQST